MLRVYSVEGFPYLYNRAQIWCMGCPIVVFVRHLSVTECARCYAHLSVGLLGSCACSYTWSLPVTWQRWQSHHLIRHSRNTMLHTTLWLCFMEPELLPIEVLHCGNRDFRPFCFCDLDLDPMTCIYKLAHLRSLRMYKNPGVMDNVDHLTDASTLESHVRDKLACKRCLSHLTYAFLECVTFE